MKKPKLLVNFVHASARRAGYEVIPLWRIHTWSLATLLDKIFKAKGIDCVLDVGANRGQFVNFLRQEVGYEGEVISFEPIQGNAQFLRSKAMADEKWRICPYALGRNESRGNLKVMRCDDFSSFLDPSNEGAPEYSEMNSVARIEAVDIRRLDTALEELNIEPTKKSLYLKMDTQGFDLEVIAGATSVVKHVRALQTEVSCIPIYEQMPDITETIRALGDLNFHLAGFFPVARRPDLSVVEFDAIFVNTSIVDDVRTEMT